MNKSAKGLLIIVTMVLAWQIADDSTNLPATRYTQSVKMLYATASLTNIK